MNLGIQHSALIRLMKLNEEVTKMGGKTYIINISLSPLESMIYYHYNVKVIQGT